MTKGYLLTNRKPKRNEICVAYKKLEDLKKKHAARLANRVERRIQNL